MGLILYVDDERQNRVVFQHSVPKDFRVQVAESAEAALAIMEEEEVAVLVTDMRMQGMSGDQLLRIAKERWPSTIRMVITAYSTIDPILHAINDGLVARYIVKPWNRDELVQSLRWAVGAWQLGRDSAAVYRRLLENERLATLGSLSGMVVHDMRQPLMSLMVNVELVQALAEHAELLQRGLALAGGPDVEDVSEMIGSLAQTAEDMRLAVDHTSKLVSGLRAIGKPRQGDDQDADPLPLIKQAMSACHEVAVVYDGPDELPPVRMQATALVQVLINLVANAGQAIVAGGNPGRIVVCARVDEPGMLTLEVRDTGPGMTREVLERAGTPFFTTRDAGTGLGVANCQRLVGSAGGRMRIKSEVGVGTAVTIMLPTG